MATKSKFHVFTKKNLKKNKVPVTVLHDQKVYGKEAAEKLLNKLISSSEPYIEFHNGETGVKMVYTKPVGVKNYTKKEHRL